MGKTFQRIAYIRFGIFQNALQLTSMGGIKNMTEKCPELVHSEHKKTDLESQEVEKAKENNVKAVDGIFLQDTSTNSLKERLKKGKLLEQPTSSALTKLAIKHTHNDFEHYNSHNYGFGTDLQSATFEIECKNLKAHTFISQDWIDTHIIKRFRYCTKKGYVVISHDTFTYRQKRTLDKIRVKIIELGFQVTEENKERAEQVLRMKLSFLVKHVKNVKVLSRLFVNWGSCCPFSRGLRCNSDSCVGCCLCLGG